MSKKKKSKTKPRHRSRIDKAILPAIQCLNKLGLHTRYCCAQHKSKKNGSLRAYITFELEPGVELEVERSEEYGDRFTIYWKRQFKRGRQRLKINP